jgi:D-cysteine desulfhydrase family pyridoxal phosphate-dependent enzyme
MFRRIPVCVKLSGDLVYKVLSEGANMDMFKKAKSKLAAVPKVNLCFLPTPFEKMQNLSELFKRINLFFKRDDQTGLAMGGNKARKLEFIMADVLRQQAKSIITWGGFHSNWCRQVAAAAKKYHIKPILLLLKKPGSRNVFNGNYLLSSLMAADIRIVEVDKDQKLMELKGVKQIIDPVFHEEENQGNKPYIASIGGSLLEGSMKRPWGAIGYVNAFFELLQQAAAQQVTIDVVVVATGSAGTHAGLLAGAKLFSPGTKVVGISVSEDKNTLDRYIKNIADEIFVELEIDLKTGARDIIVFDEYIKEGYGVLNKEVADSIRLVAEREGVLLDPVYTGKAMVGLVDLVKKGYFKDRENVVFFHTGGTPSLFPYGSELAGFCQN